MDYVFHFVYLDKTKLEKKTLIVVLLWSRPIIFSILDYTGQSLKKHKEIL